MNAQEIANELYYLGYTDTQIADIAHVTREYINKIRSGKKTASAALEGTLSAYLTKVQRKAAGSSNPQAETDTPSPYLIAGVIAAAILIVGIAVYIRLQKVQQPPKHISEEKAAEKAAAETEKKTKEAEKHLQPRETASADNLIQF